MGREEGVGVGEVGRGEERSTHVDREEVGAMPASHRHCLEQTRARNTHLYILIHIYQN